MIPEGRFGAGWTDARVDNAGVRLLDDKTSRQQNPCFPWGRLQVGKAEPEKAPAHWALALQVQDCLFRRRFSCPAAVTESKIHAKCKCMVYDRLGLKPACRSLNIAICGTGLQVFNSSMGP